VLVQSPSMRHVYGAAYDLHAEQLVDAPPPVVRITELARSSDGDECAQVIASLPAPCTQPGADPGCVTLVTLGKLQRVKSPHTVVGAVAALLATSPMPPVHLVMLGGDADCDMHGQRMTACIAQAFPGAAAERVHVVLHLPHKCAAAAVRHVRPTAAIMASEFETYNLVAHEMAAFGVPLVVSDIAAYRPFLATGSAYAFQAGSATSLLSVLQDVVAAVGNGSPLRQPPTLRYADPVAPYRALLAQAAAVRNGTRAGVATGGEPGGAPADIPQPSAALQRAVERDAMLIEGDCCFACRDHALATLRCAVLQVL
jgi:hypothetical protein